MLVAGLLLIGAVLVGALAIRSRAPARQPPRPVGRSTGPDAGPERRLWEIWKRLGWGERLTVAALAVGGLGVVSLGLFGLVLLVW